MTSPTIGGNNTHSYEIREVVFDQILSIAVFAVDWRRAARDWLHWLGISLWTINVGLALLLALLALVVPKSGGMGGAALQFGLPDDASKSATHRTLGWLAGDYFSDSGHLKLCRAIEAGNVEEIKRLVQSGVDVNARGRKNMTPLLWAFPMGEKVFKTVLDLGADPNVKLTANVSPSLVFKKGRSVLIALGFVANQPQFHLNDFSKEKYLKLLLDHGGDPNIEDDSGNTLLFYLSDENNKGELIRLLLNAGADINHQNKRGNTPLLSVDLGLHADAALTLLKAGADYRIASVHGSDFVLRLAAEDWHLEKYKKPDDYRYKVEKAAIQPILDWLTQEGVNWEAARARIELEERARKPQRAG